jgi:hypothetical protein
MSNRMEMICFTDLVGSTALDESAGNHDYTREMIDHERVIQSLVERLGGEWKKGMGDGHLLLLDSLESGAKFMVQLQQYYKAQPALIRRDLSVKIALYLGVAQPVGDDIHGSAVIRASRLQEFVEPGQIVVSADYVKAITRANTSLETYFESLGEQKLRNVEEQEKLFTFDWERFGRDFPNDGLTGVVFEHLRGANVVASLLTANDFASPGTVIWPVVPRDLATAIHRGQAEIARLLGFLGWKVKLLIADCGTQTNNYDRSYSEAFCHKLQAYLAARSVRIEETFYLSDFFDPSFPNYAQVQHIFRTIASELTLQDLLNINNKDYSDDVKAEIKRSATLDCLRPALSLAAVLYILEHETGKLIIISGEDERIQWDRAYDLRGTSDRLGVLMNPILGEGRHQLRQRARRPSWSSQATLEDEMSSGNLAWWTFKLHACLPAFPSRYLKIGPHLPFQHWLKRSGHI